MTNEPKWTPGPWGLRKAASGDHAITRGPVAMMAECFVDIRNANENAVEECAANAHLIAAAPEYDTVLGELLDALQDALCNSDAPDFDKTRLDAAVASATALRAKARGEVNG